MARRVFVHIGTAKSGTTVLQSVLWENRHALADAGLTFPGVRPDSHYLATLDLLGMQYAGYANPLAENAWSRMVDAVRAAPQDAVISHELLSRADDAQVARLMADLAPAEVHVLVTVRHLARQAGSTWQENIRNGQVESWPEFVAAITDTSGAVPALAEVFRTYQDHPAYLARWAAHVRPEDVHVRGLIPGATLWHDVSDVFGIDPDLAVMPATSPGNSSLGMDQTELLRLVNVHVRDRIGFREYAQAVKEGLATEVLAAQPDPQPIRLPPAAFEVLSRRHDAMVATVRAAGYDVDSRIDDLDPGRAADAREAARIASTAPGLLLGADALAGFVLLMAGSHYRVDPVAKVKGAALDLVEVRPWARVALRVYLRVKSEVGARRGAARS